jgi:hypothetical protein
MYSLSILGRTPLRALRHQVLLPVGDVVEVCLSPCTGAAEETHVFQITITQLIFKLKNFNYTKERFYNAVFVEHF